MPSQRPDPGDRRREVRTVAATGLKVERRDDADAPRIVGHAIVYDQWTTLHEGRSFVWREKIARGACRSALAEGQDVRCLFNHDPNYVLGRTKSGTLRLTEDATGLLAEIDPPDTPTVRDLVLAPIARGDVSGMSFSFLVREGGQVVTTREEGDRIVEEREVLALDLLDVSPVTFPAYEQTDVALRSLAERREREFRSLAARRLARMRIRQRMSDALSL